MNRPMKRLFTLFLSGLSLTFLAQSPQGVSYQAVAMNADGTTLENQSIAVRFSILEDSQTGDLAFTERHNTTTDAFGMFNLILGQGIYLGGYATILSDVDWGQSIHFLRVELDLIGNGSFTTIGTQQMMSVPYAMYAESAGNATPDGDGDSTNEIQTISLNEGILSLSSGGGSIDLSDDVTSIPLNNGINVQCVDMGLSPLCASLGLSPNVTLTPSSNGYFYSLCANSGLDANNQIDCPHWRKFQIHGLSDESIETIVIRYHATYSSNTNYYDVTITPEVDEGGNMYLYFYKSQASSADCTHMDNIFLTIPQEHSMRVGEGSGYYNNSGFEIWYSNGASLVFTNLLLRF